MGTCTLACCKPSIRRSVGRHFSKHQDTWILGISPKNKGNEIVNIMRVDEAMSFNDYFRRYPEKRPIFHQSIVGSSGDNIYQPLEDCFIQLRSIHSNKPFEDENWSTNMGKQIHDLGGEFVLLSKNYVYFGGNSITVPNELRSIIPGRGHKCNFDEYQIKHLEKLVNVFKQEIESCTLLGPPRKWPSGNTEWNPNR